MGVDIGGIFERRSVSFDAVPKSLAVDAFNTLYQFLTIIRQRDGTPLMDGKGRVTSHLSGLFYRTSNLLEKGLRPVFVFDGEPSVLKHKTIEERLERKHEALELFEKAKAAGNEEEMNKYAQRTAKLTGEMINESKQLLKLMGVPWIQAPSEGEAQCATMAAQGVVEAVASQDFDALLFGAPILIRNLTIAGKRKLPGRNLFVDVSPERIDLDADLKKLGLTREKLIWIGLLCGTDFNTGVRGIGAKKGLKLAQKFDSFDNVLESLHVEMDYAPVLELFTHPPSKPVTKKEIEFKQPERDALRAFMHDEHDFTLERVDAALERAFKQPAGSAQSGLNAWLK